MLMEEVRFVLFGYNFTSEPLIAGASVEVRRELEKKGITTSYVRNVQGPSDRSEEEHAKEMRAAPRNLGTDSIEASTDS
jgi:hypothetical protein